MKTALIFSIGFAFTCILGRAADFESAGSGNWSNPGNWSPVGVPDPFGADKVTVKGRLIDYDGGSSSGYLSVANDNSITIDAGALTQTGLDLPIIIGDGGGSLPGGLLRIQNGGLFDTGASFGLIIGGSVTGSLPGNGTATIRDGTLRIGVGATLLGGGIGIGLDGSTGVMSVGDSEGAAGTALLDLTGAGMAAGAQMGIGTSALGSTGGTGALTVNSDGKVIQGMGTIFAGEAGGTGSLTIESGGQLLSSGGHVHIGDFNGAVGIFVSRGNVIGIGELVVGVAQAGGTASIQSGIFQANSAFIGRDGGNGTLNVSGAAVVTIDERLKIGEGAGNGVVNLNGGTVQTGYVEAGSGSAVLKISGGILRANGSETSFVRGFNGAGSHSSVVLEGAGAVIDTNGHDVGIGPDNLLTGSGLTKVGSGTLTLGAVQSYDLLKISEGAVILDAALGAGNATIDVRASITLHVSQSLASLEIGPGATAVLAANTAPATATPVPEPGLGALILAGAFALSSPRRKN